MLAAAAWIAMLVGSGFGERQAAAIARFSAVESSPERGAFHLSMPLDPCAHSWRGEGLLGVTQRLRWELHEFAGAADLDHLTFDVPRGACVSASMQAAYLAQAFPRHYPVCAAEFARGDLGAFKRCWGEGHSR